jgi:hypothetical protein
MKDQDMTVREVVIMEQVLLGKSDDMAVWLKDAILVGGTGQDGR